ncbi:hypothetical protein Tco_0172549 [Tanacetum coccineum]
MIVFFNIVRNDGRLSFGCCLRVIGDGASWSTVVEEGEPVNTARTGATTSSIRAMTSGAGRSTLGGGESFHEVRVLMLCSEAIAVSSSKST